MIRDKENLAFELMDERYDDDTQDAIAGEETDDETGGLNFRTLAAYARARGDVAEAGKWEAKAAAQDAPARYTVTMSSEQYQAIYGAVLQAEIVFGARQATSTGLTAEFAAEDCAQAKAAIAILDSLNYRRVA